MQVRTPDGLEPLLPLSDFALDPDRVHLNHGAFGGPPREVLDVAKEWRERLERDPTTFYVRHWRTALQDGLDAAAALIGVPADGVLPVLNATVGTATVLASRRWEAGDRVVLTDHGYPAVSAQVAALARHGVVADVVPALPLDGLPDRIGAAIGRRTRLVVVDQITSPTALVLPVAAIAGVATDRGVDVCVDAAHVPGHLDVDVDALGVQYWTGNLHKWAAAPRACAVLWATPDRRDELVPLVPSSAFTTWPDRQAAFGWSGTHDTSAWLSVPAALAWHGRLPTLRTHASALLDEAATVLPWPPLDGSAPMMRCFALPAGTDEVALRDRLDAAGLTVATPRVGEQAYLRLSAYAYTSSSDLDHLKSVPSHPGAGA